jgi:hypothetical protein
LNLDVEELGHLFILAINVAMITMVDGIFALMCSGCCLFYLCPLSISSSPPWKIRGALSASNHLATPLFGVCFQGTMSVHIPHPLSLD